MKLYQIYFSPTGGTEKVVRMIADAWECEKETVDLISPAADGSGWRFQEEDLCLVAVPSFGGRVPAAASEKLQTLFGGQARAVPICVYGNRAYEDTLLELNDILERRGFRCIAGVAAVAEHSILHQFAAGRPDEEDHRELLRFSEEIKKRLDDGKSTVLNIPGNRPYREYGVIPMVPKPSRGCSQCGLCARECPVSAISLTDSAVVDADKCISCMRCTAICPQHVRHVSSLALAAASQKLKKACSGRKGNELF